MTVDVLLINQKNPLTLQLVSYHVSLSEPSLLPGLIALVHQSYDLIFLQFFLLFGHRIDKI